MRTSRPTPDSSQSQNTLWLALTTALALATAGCVQPSDGPAATTDTGGGTDTTVQDTAVDTDTEVPVDPVIAIDGPHGVTVGLTAQLVATTMNGTDSAYTWSVTDEAVASIDETGLLLAISPGETYAEATGADTGAIGRHAIVVVPAGVSPPAEVKVTGSHGLLIGMTLALSAETLNGADTSYTWSSEAEGVATVDADGNVTAVAPGEGVILATGTETQAVGRHVIVVYSADATPGPDVPFFNTWAASPHGDKSAPAFNHWNNDDPAEIPTTCARCHSSTGYQDYIGADGSTPWVVDAPAPVGTTVECATCHNSVTPTLSSVTFPSGVTVNNLGPEARCMTCHQGRASTDTVNAAIVEAAAPNDDTPSDKLGFMNIHYYAAGATIYAGKVRGGYQYDGKTYDWRFRHVEGLDNCVGCHDPHSLEVRTDLCAGCHTGVTTAESARNIRMVASLNQDYDGDGNTSEGIYFEIQGLRERLMQAIRSYTTGEGFGAICYNGSTFPYWFKDTNGNGTCEPEEAGFANRFTTWSPRLVRASYNYQVSLKDPGAFAHNAKYLIQLLFDSVEDISVALGQPLLLGPSVRNDSGHFNGAGRAARNWDSSEQINATCSKCHSGAEGLHFYLQYGVSKIITEPPNGLECSTCHTSFGDTYNLLEVKSVTYPGGLTLPSADSVTNLCSTCHSGRESRATIDERIATGSYAFRNIHYLPAAAVKAGSDAHVGYEYDGKDYAKTWTGHPGGDGCNNCHNAKLTGHSFKPNDMLSTCKLCHQDAATLKDIRTKAVHGLDYDGDGNANEPLAGEIETLSEALMAQIAQVALAGSGQLICYEGSTNPYFFIDTNGNGKCDGIAEAVSANSFKGWTPALMRAAHNYQISKKDKGAWSHNFDYMIQLLIDSIEDLGGNTSAYTRP